MPKRAAKGKPLERFSTSGEKFTMAGQQWKFLGGYRYVFVFFCFTILTVV